jgi:VanZ family protein
MKDKIFKTLNEFLEKLIIPYDKALHFVYGFLFFFIVSLLFNPTVGLLSNIFLAFSKEVYDYFAPNHKSSLMDIIYTLIPALLSYFLIFYNK